MDSHVYRYTFAPATDMGEVEATLVLALLATENLHGESVMRLDARHTFDTATRQCVIDTGSVVGRDLAKLFVGFLQREFGPDSFTVERLTATNHPRAS